MVEIGKFIQKSYTGQNGQIYTVGLFQSGTGQNGQILVKMVKNYILGMYQSSTGQKC